MILLYTQCKLKNGNKVEVAWIPTQFAKQGMQLLIGNGADQYGAVVTDVWQSTSRDMARQQNKWKNTFASIADERKD